MWQPGGVDSNCYIIDNQDIVFIVELGCIFFFSCWDIILVPNKISLAKSTWEKTALICFYAHFKCLSWINHQQKKYTQRLSEKTCSLTNMTKFDHQRFREDRSVNVQTQCLLRLLDSLENFQPTQS